MCQYVCVHDGVHLLIYSIDDYSQQEKRYYLFDPLQKK